MRYTIDIECDNSAFDENPRKEIARILDDAREAIMNMDAPEKGDISTMKLPDSNGNQVALVLWRA